MKKTWLVAGAVAAGVAFGEQGDVTRGGFTVSQRAQPESAARLTFSADGKRATLNTARVPEAARGAATERAFRLMAAAADTKKGGFTRPLMGWSSWNTFGVDISEEIILETARAMASNGLKDAGYTYVNIDDGFFNGHGPDGILRFHPKRFPNGMKPTVDGIHALGLKAGIYSDAGADTCGSMWGGSGSGGKDNGGRGAGLYGHDAADCKLHFNDLGFDFIKVDYCGGRALKLDERARYTEIANAIRKTGRPVRFNICRWAFPGTWAADIAESWRTTGDIRANWRSVRNIIGENLYLAPYARLGHYNDMDMLEVGQLKGQVKSIFGKHGDTGLTADEETTHFGMWCMMSSPLLIGCDVRTIPASTLELITNPFLLTMSQNELGVQGSVVSREGEAYVIAKDADARFGTARFLALYNAEDNPHAFDVPFASLELDGAVEVFDLVGRTDLGAHEKSFAVTVPPHATRFYRLDAARRADRANYEAESAYLSEYQEIHNAERAGTAFPAQARGASAGVLVRYLGNRETNDLVWKDVRVSQDGTYELAFTCAHNEARNFDVQIDGGAKTRLAYDGKSKEPVVMTVPLKAGVHAVRISNATAWCPDIDRMQVRQK